MNQKLNSNNSKKIEQIIISSIGILFSSILFLHYHPIISGSICCFWILGLFSALNKDLKSICTRLIICLIPGIFIILGSIVILNNNNKVLQTEAKIISVNQENKIIRGQNHTQFNYKIEYTINNVKYYDTISDSWDSIQPLQVGDTKKIVVCNNKDRILDKNNYKYTDKDYKTLSAGAKKDNVCPFIFLICFPGILCVLLLYASDQSTLADMNQSNKIKLDKKVINKK